MLLQLCAFACFLRVREFINITLLKMKCSTMVLILWPDLHFMYFSTHHQYLFQFYYLFKRNVFVNGNTVTGHTALLVYHWGRIYSACPWIMSVSDHDCVKGNSAYLSFFKYLNGSPIFLHEFLH